MREVRLSGNERMTRSIVEGFCGLRRYITVLVGAGLLVMSVGCRGDESIIGILNPTRIDMVEYSYERNWQFLPQEEIAATAVFAGCGVRFVEGRLHKYEGEEQVQLVEYLGEFCEPKSELGLRGEYIVAIARDRGAMWITHVAKIYLWKNGLFTVPLNPWLASLKIERVDSPCSDIVVGPFGGTNTDDTRVCTTFDEREILTD